MAAGDRRDPEEDAAPLRGLRVVEAASMVLVPSAAAMLADFGADVVKVEPLGGDQNRVLHELPGMPTSDIAYSFLLDNRPTYPEIADDAQAEAAGLFPALGAPHDGMRTVDSPIRLPDVPKAPPRPAPALGAHTAEVLVDLGFSVAEIDDALARGVVAQAPRGGRGGH